MFLHLAQLSADMVGPVVTWILGASGAMFLLNQALTFYKDHIKEDPSPAGTYATKQDLKEAHGRMNREKAEIEAKLAAAEARLKAEVGEIKTAVATYNANAEGRSNAINSRIDDLSDKISDAPEAVVEMLVKTKGLLG